MGEEWGALPEFEKKRFWDQEHVEWERYLKDKADWNKANPAPKEEKKETKPHESENHKKDKKKEKGKAAKINKSATAAPAKVEKLEKAEEKSKRPTSAFFFYQAEWRTTLKAEKPTLSNKDIVWVSSS